MKKTLAFLFGFVFIAAAHPATALAWGTDIECAKQDDQVPGSSIRFKLRSAAGLGDTPVEGFIEDAWRKPLTRIEFNSRLTGYGSVGCDVRGIDPALFRCDAMADGQPVQIHSRRLQGRKQGYEWNANIEAVLQADEVFDILEITLRKKGQAMRVLQFTYGQHCQVGKPE